MFTLRAAKNFLWKLTGIYGNKWESPGNLKNRRLAILPYFIGA